MNTDKSIFVSQHYLAIEIGNVFDDQKRKLLEATAGDKTYLPTPSTLYSKELVESYTKPKLTISNGSLFKTSKRSRFSFINKDSSNDTTANSIEVPDFICNILNKELSSYSKFKCCDDSLLSSEKLFNNCPNDHPWADFVASLSSDNFINLAKFNSA
jgi:hypothetical protein